MDRVKQQKLALTMSSTLDSYNGRQLILQTEQLSGMPSVMSI